MTNEKFFLYFLFVFYLELKSFRVQQDMFPSVFLYLNINAFLSDIFFPTSINYTNYKVRLYTVFLFIKGFTGFNFYFSCMWNGIVGIRIWWNMKSWNNETKLQLINNHFNDLNFYVPHPPTTVFQFCLLMNILCVILCWWTNYFILMGSILWWELWLHLGFDVSQWHSLLEFDILTFGFHLRRISDLWKRSFWLWWECFEWENICSCVH